ncbi:DinB family protein [Mucilaginibacter celer]|uniref:DinB family protein n=1 Tax=Mucilaginibacter celer TaxID=2305508 RepID=A0A494VND2_9SPHI|nr:DinB family protein [Mucilaginibacter celer]AYL96184.1 DinB family protein [Mucilaginibacter celer]
MENATFINNQTEARSALKAEFEHTASSLLTTLAGFKPEQINTEITANSWTAGQVAEHLFKSAVGIPPLFAGNTEPAQRDPAEKKQTLRDIFLDFNARYKAAPNIVPSNGPHKKAEVIAALEAVIPQIKEIINTQDLFALCTDVDVPMLGKMTRLEWLYLVCYHTQRHIHQLENIRQAL